MFVAKFILLSVVHHYRVVKIITWYVDAHTHAHTLPRRDLELMYLANIREIVICNFVPLVEHAETLIDHFKELIHVHKPRLMEIGFKVYVFIGIHPRNIPEGWQRILPVLEDYAVKGTIQGIGEIGLETGSNIEIEVLREQLKIAKEYKLPVVIHTPKNNRINIVKRIIQTIKEVGVETDKIVIDHVNDDIIDLVNDIGAIPGLSIKPGFLTPSKIAENIEKYKNGVLNSDCINLNDTDPLAVPKSVNYLSKALYFSERIILERLAYLNAYTWLGGSCC